MGTRVRVKKIDRHKKKARPARGPERVWKILRRCTHQRHVQTAGFPCMDRVAVLWENPAAHDPEYVKGTAPSR